MKKTWLSLVALLLIAGCGGNELDLDVEQVTELVSERALEQKVIEEGGYDTSDIQVVKVCEAIEKGKEDFGFDGNYIVYWQTADRKYQRTFLLDNNSELSHGDVNYNPVEDRCVEIE